MLRTTIIAGLMAMTTVAFAQGHVRIVRTGRGARFPAVFP